MSLEDTQIYFTHVEINLQYAHDIKEEMDRWEAGRKTHMT